MPCLAFVNTIWAVLWNVVQNQPFLISHHRLFNKGSNYDCSHVCWYVKTLPTSPASESERDLMEPRMDIKRWLAGAESVTSRDSTMAAASPPQLLTSFTLTHSAVRSPPSHSPAGREVTKTFQMNLRHCLTVCYCRLFSLWDRVTWLPNGQFGIRSTFLKWSTAPKERHWSTRTHKSGPLCWATHLWIWRKATQYQFVAYRVFGWSFGPFELGSHKMMRGYFCSGAQHKMK